MKTKTITTIICCAIIIASCQTKTENNPDHFVEVNGKKIPLIRMDLVEDSATTIGLSALFDDVEIIPLETSENCMIMNWRTVLKDNSLLLATQSGGLGPVRLLEFELNGRFIKEIGGGGKGPGEHAGYSLESASYYPLEELLLCEFMGYGPETQLFNKHGKFIKSVKVPLEISTGIARVGEDLYITPGSIDGRPMYNRDSVQLIWYSSAGDVKKSIPREQYPPENTSGYSPGAWGTSLYQYGKDLHYYSPANDTIYAINNLDIWPLAIVINGKDHVQVNEVIDPKEVIGTYFVKIVGENEKYWIFEKRVTTVADLHEYRPGQWGGMFDMDYSNVIVEKKTGKSHHLRFNDDLLGVIPWKYVVGQLTWDFSGRVYMVVQALNLVEWIDEALEQGLVPESGLDKVKTLRQAIDEDSNPVLFMFKEREKYGLD
ncbi:MAG: 6-bladed beta-propeller [Bacteroidota bacterium]|nr:6-bladed beta-propeller [Bacteroidota bacterium]